VSDNLTIMIGLLAALVGGVLFLWLRDRLYVDRTGKPASERIRDQKERANRPITKVRYLVLSALDVIAIVLFVLALFWSRDYKGWAILIPLCIVLNAGFALHQLQARWRRQQRSETPSVVPDQLSGPAR